MSTEKKKNHSPKNISVVSDNDKLRKNRADLASSFKISKFMVGASLSIALVALLITLGVVFVLLKVAQPKSETIAATINDSSQLVVGNVLDMTPTIRQAENFTQDCFDIMYRATSSDFRKKQTNLNQCFYNVFLNEKRNVFERDFVNNFTERGLSGAIEPFLNRARVIGSNKTADPDCLARMTIATSENGLIGCFKVDVDLDLRFLFYGVNTFDDVSKKFEIMLDVVSRDVNSNGLMMYRMRELND